MGDSIIVNGVEYAPKVAPAMDADGQICIVRCRDAGVHCGTVNKPKDGQILVTNSRRLWRWHSGATLSELSQTGPTPGEEQNYGCVLPSLYLRESDVCEIIPCTAVAAKMIADVPKWVNR